MTVFAIGIAAVWWIVHFFSRFIKAFKWNDIWARKIYYPTAALLTSREQDFFNVVEELLEHPHRIFVKVRLQDVVDSKFIDYKYTNPIRLKHLDFVIVNSRFRPICAIEVQDSTHLSARGVASDSVKQAVLNDAWIPLVMLWSLDKDDVASLLLPHLR